MFRFLSRAQCSVEELVTAENKRFPTRGFLLVHDPTFADVFEHCAPCEVDKELFKPYFRKFPTAAAMRTLPARVELRAMAWRARRVNHRIESLNASLRRMCYRVPQAKRPTPRGILVRWAINRRSSARLHRSHVGANVTRCRQIQKSACKLKIKKELPPRQSPTKQGHRGGAWRAFIRLKTSGNETYQQDFSQLAQQYKVMDEETSARVNAMSVAAADRNRKKRPKPHESSFGVRPAKVRRVARAIHRVNFAKRCDADGDKGLEALSRSLGPEQALAALVKTSRKRMTSSSRTWQAKQLESKYVAMRRDFGDAEVVATLHAFPKLPLKSIELTPRPDRLMTVVELDPASELTAKRLQNAIKTEKRGSAFAGAVELFVATCASQIGPRDSTKIPGPTKASKKIDECRLSGVCLCSAEGKRLLQFANRSIACLKRACRTIQGTKALLSAGFLLLRFSEAGPDASQDDLYLHIGLQYLSPFRPTFTVMSPRERSAAEIDLSEEFIALEAGEAQRLHIALATLDLEVAWTLSIMKLWESNMPLPQCEFIPGQQLVCSYGAATPLWPPPRRARGQAVHNDGLQDIADEDSSDGSEEDRHGADAGLDAEAERMWLEECLALSMEVGDLREGEEELINNGDDADEGGVLEDNGARPGSSGDPLPEDPVFDGVVSGNLALASFSFNGGKIMAYKDGSMVAYCNHGSHKHCQIRRTRRQTRNNGKGRPLGLLAWFLLNDAYANNQAHQDAAKSVSKQEREQCRIVLLSTPHAAEVAVFERHKNEGEADEPDVCP